MADKKWLRYGLLLLPLVSASAWGASPATDEIGTGPGCGLGKVVWADYSRPKSIAPQVMMATTNGTSGSQTFGISSGTSGCTNDGTIMSEYKATVFAAANYDSLSQEMARGGGEHLASLADLMGVPEESRPEFFAMAQTRYATLVGSFDASPAAMILSLQNGMEADPAFAKLTSN